MHQQYLLSVPKGAEELHHHYIVLCDSFYYNNKQKQLASTKKAVEWLQLIDIFTLEEGGEDYI